MSEEIKRLDEQIPKDLAKKIIPRANRKRRAYVSYDNLTDYFNSTYDLITPDEAHKMWKAGNPDDLAKIYVLIDDRLVKFNEKGKVVVDYNFDVSKPFINRNGKPVYAIKILNIRHLFDTADKIYYVNEVQMSQDKIDKNKKYDDTSYNSRYDVTSLGNPANADDWFIPDTGSHDDADGYRGFGWSDSISSRKRKVSEIKSSIERDKKIINMWPSEKDADRSRSFVDYITSLHSDRSGDLSRARQRLRDARIESDTYSQRVNLAASRRLFNDLKGKIHSAEYDYKRAQERLADMTANRLDSGEYRGTVSDINYVKSRIAEYERSLAELRQRLVNLENKISDTAVNSKIEAEQQAVDNLKASITSYRQELDKLLKKSPKTESITLDESIFN